MPPQYLIGPRAIDERLRHVRIQGRHVHIDNLGEVISNYNRPIVVDSAHENFPFYFRGSACLLTLKDRPFVATCFHNLKDMNSQYDHVFLQARLGGGNQYNIPLCRVFTPKTEFQNTDDCFDLAFFEADLSLLPEGIDCEFFDISRDPACHVPVSKEPILACGFPLRQGSSDYDNQSISRPAVIVDGRFERWSNAPHLYYCKIRNCPGANW